MEKVTKSDVENSTCVLLKQKFANGSKTVSIYIDEFEEGLFDFNLEYNTEYANGNGLHGNGFADLEETLEAFGFNSYNELKDYLVNKFKDKDDCWDAVINEFDENGVELNVDEDECIADGNGGFIMTDLF